MILQDIKRWEEKVKRSHFLLRIIIFLVPLFFSSCPLIHLLLPLVSSLFFVTVFSISYNIHCFWFLLLLPPLDSMQSFESDKLSSEKILSVTRFLYIFNILLSVCPLYVFYSVSSNLTSFALVRPSVSSIEKPIKSLYHEKRKYHLM